MSPNWRRKFSKRETSGTFGCTKFQTLYKPVYDDTKEATNAPNATITDESVTSATDVSDELRKKKKKIPNISELSQRIRITTGKNYKHL